MNLPPLDDRLHRLADQLTAPPTAEARQGIGRRAGVLRRRRRVRNAVGGGLLAAAVVAGGLVVNRDRADDVEMGPAGPAVTGSASLPTLTVELGGWSVVAAADVSVAADGPPDADPAMEGSFQVFRDPGDPTGPTAALYHHASFDPAQAEPEDRTVAIGDTDGYLRQTGDRSFTLRWNPNHGDSYARLQAWGLSEAQVLDLANGLQLKDDEISNPPRTDVEFGFVATRLPDGMAEIRMNPVNRTSPGIRRLVLDAGKRTAEVVIDQGGEEAFEAELADLLKTAGDVDEMTVLERPAIAIEHPDDASWSLIWRHTDHAFVVATLTRVDRAMVADVAAGVREITEDEWYDMVAEHR